MKKIYNAPQTKVVAVASKGTLCVISGPEVNPGANAEQQYGMDARENNGWAQSSSVWDD